MVARQNGKWTTEETKSSQTKMNGAVSGHGSSSHEEPADVDLRETEPRHSITVTLTDEDLTLLEQVGQGSYSDGLRLALRAWRREAATWLAKAARIAAEIQVDPTTLISHEELQHRLTEKNDPVHVVAP